MVGVSSVARVVTASESIPPNKTLKASYAEDMVPEGRILLRHDTPVSARVLRPKLLRSEQLFGFQIGLRIVPH